MEEIIWRQRSRVVWLQHGDKNSKFFHKKEEHKRKTNFILKLKDESGYWWRGEEAVERPMVSYFSNLFSSFMPENIEEAFTVVMGKLSVDHVNWCEDSFSTIEVQDALFQMSPTKAPGPNGLPALFFQKYWHVIGQDVCNLALAILNNDRDPRDINDTHIVLIPK